MNKRREESEKSAATLVAALVSFLSPFMGAAANIALPTIGTEMRLDAVLLSWVATIYLLASAAFLLPFGRIADIYGRKRIFLIGVIVFSLSSLGCSLSFSAWMLLLFRAVQGIGSSMIFGTSVAILTSVFPPGERGRALGINVAAVYLGLSLGPFLGGLLTQQLGWRSVFYVNVPLGVIILLVTLSKLTSEWAEARGEKMDFLGSIVYIFSLLALMYGLSEIPKAIGFVLMIFGAAALGAFLFLESRTASPVLHVGLFKTNRTFAFSNLAALIHYGATFAVGFLLSLYLQYVKGLTPQESGLILVSQPIVMTIVSPFAGRLSDRIEPRYVASVGMGCTSFGLGLMTLLDGQTGLPFIIAALMILGFGFALFSSPNTNAIMSSVERNFLGVASAMVGTMRVTGMMVSMGVAMLLFTLIMGRTQITPEHADLFLKSARMALGIFTGLCFFGIFASLARGKLR
jgi:EmrB/QacA subfamily drug resistance transporter